MFTQDHVFYIYDGRYVFTFYSVYVVLPLIFFPTERAMLTTDGFLSDRIRFTVDHGGYMMASGIAQRQELVRIGLIEQIFGPPIFALCPWLYKKTVFLAFKSGFAKFYGENVK